LANGSHPDFLRRDKGEDNNGINRSIGIVSSGGSVPLDGIDLVVVDLVDIVSSGHNDESVGAEYGIKELIELIIDSLQ
jgi:hypothetical protein